MNKTPATMNMVRAPIRWITSAADGPVTMEQMMYRLVAQASQRVPPNSATARGKAVLTTKALKANSTTPKATVAVAARHSFDQRSDHRASMPNSPSVLHLWNLKRG